MQLLNFVVMGLLSHHRSPVMDPKKPRQQGTPPSPSGLLLFLIAYSLEVEEEGK